MTIETANTINETLKKIDEEFQKARNNALAPARNRLAEIQEIKAQLQKEEEDLYVILGEDSPRGRRRHKGKRMTALHKKEIMGRFIEEGHIKHNSALTRELRAALTDEGFGINDFRKLTAYLPNGWEARSNGLRGTAAKTTFHTI
jgi:hypothetical protein